VTNADHAANALIVAKLRAAFPDDVVLSEEMEGDAWSANNGGPPFDDHCHLVLEIAARALVQPENADAFIITPATDAELEALLDLLEHRAVDALAVGDTAQSRLVRQAVTRRISKQKSVRFADAETGIKLAERTVTLLAELKGEDQADATVAPTGEFAALPDPLRTVCEAMTDGSAGQAICRLIAATLPAPNVELFTGIDETVAPQQRLDPSAAPLAPTVSGSHDTFGVNITIP